MAQKEYIELLRASAKKQRSIACVGLDPVLEKIPLKENNTEKKITGFYSTMIQAMSDSGVMPGAFKPNYAFYAQYGFPGLRALQKVIENARSTGIPVILDAKRGDIGSTSAAYAKEAFEFWKADALTVAPYMGFDSVAPFIKWCEQNGKGIYILNRTSNAGAADLQNLNSAGESIYMHVSAKIAEWGKNAKGNVGAVVGATSQHELMDISSFFSKQRPPVPMLIPGVGAQGGSAGEVAGILRSAGLGSAEQRINSSSAINYAYEKTGTSDYAGAAVKALKEMNKEIGFG